MKMQNVFLAAAAILFAIAFYFGNEPSWEKVNGSTGFAIAYNCVACFSSFGFALAGGLALLSAAIVTKKEI